MGKLKEFTVPTTMEEGWLGHIRNQLLTDLMQAIQLLPRSMARNDAIIEPELCMVGDTDGKSTAVQQKSCTASGTRPSIPRNFQQRKSSNPSPRPEISGVPQIENGYEFWIIIH